MKKYSSHILPKTRNMSVKQDNFKDSLLNLLNSCKLTIPEGPPSPIGATGTTEGRQNYIQGLTGETGARWPAGIRYLNSTNLYSNTTFSVLCLMAKSMVLCSGLQWMKEMLYLTESILLQQVST